MRGNSITQALISLAVVVLACMLPLTGCAPPEVVTAPPEGTTPSAPSSAEVIEDLAYIKIFVSGYSDDADPESDGISLRISFYDSKSEPITFQDIPVTVSIELYGYRDVMDHARDEKRELVYRDQYTIDHSKGEIFGAKIEIPYENIMVDQNNYYRFGTMKVTVTTPKQGNFQDMWGLVRLYLED